MADRPDRYPWLDLLEIDGPFLSRPALDDVYDEAWPPKISNEHREILTPPAVLPTEWDEAAMARVDRLLTDVLGYREGRTLKFNPGTVIHPVYDNAAVSPYALAYSGHDPDNPRLVVLAGPAAAEAPDSLYPATITTHYGWPSTAVQRAALAARGLDADLALVTNGYQHLIVWVGSGITGQAWVDPGQYRLDRRLADSFVALLSAASVTTDADTSTADLLRLSQEKQVDVTEKLGTQVRRAAEALVNAVSRANRNTDGKLLAGVAPSDVYAGVVTVLMRAVFLLNAEERDLISRGDLWDRAYSVSGLLDQLDDDHYRHQGVMRRRHGAWLRLLAAARAVHGGVNHGQMNVPAYGGNLFAPFRHLLLEGVGVDGEVFDVGVVDDATTRHVLDLLQRLDGQRLSYHAFSVEQIGQVYESLLDHSAVSVPEGEVVLGLIGAKGAEPEVELVDLEAQHTSGRLADWLAKNHDPSGGQGKVAKWQGRIDHMPDERVTATLAQACHGNVDILNRVEKFASLLRTDARDVALVFLPGDVYVTETANRRDTGTAYTSPAFAAEIAHHAVEHLVYEPGPHNEEDESKWQIKPPLEILKLRICDPAVGSGAILVGGVRYLAEKLVESRLEHGDLTPRDLETAAADPMATDPYVQARRDVVSQCIYAVDRDPMAVEMAKLSLWLITMAHGRPFTFLDHAIKCGDSLLGVTSLDQLRRLHLDESVGAQVGLDLEGGRVAGLGGYFTLIDERINKALALLELVRAGDVRDVGDARQRAEMNSNAERLLEDLRLVADAITTTCYLTVGGRSGSTETSLTGQVLPLVADIAANRDRLQELSLSRPPDAPDAVEFLHWPLEFPEVFQAGGFDAVVGNPPFIGGKKVKKALGDSYRRYLVRYVSGGDTGKTTDLIAWFFRRVEAISSALGLLATNSICQGDTRRVGLRPLAKSSVGKIFRATSSEPWPGQDAVFISKIWWTSRPWVTTTCLDERQVDLIESDLYPSGVHRGEPLSLAHRLVATAGQYVRGDGFEVSGDVAEELLADPESEEVIYEYVGGAEVNQRVDHSSERSVINFHQWTEDEAARRKAAFAIVERDVRPYRETITDDPGARERWWQFCRYLPNLVKRLASLTDAIVMASTSPYAVPVRRSIAKTVLTHGVIVFPWDDYRLLGVISSTAHRVWIDRYGTTLETRVRYSPTECFDNFPLPGRLTVSDDASQDRLEGLSDRLESVKAVACELDSWRRSSMESEGIALTKLYGRFHSEETDPLADTLREYHVQLDHAVLVAYGWSDLRLEHGYHDTRYGRFFTVSTEARFELLMRLLELNFQQAAEQTGRSLKAVIREAQKHV